MEAWCRAARPARLGLVARRQTETAGRQTRLAHDRRTHHDHDHQRADYLDLARPRRQRHLLVRRARRRPQQRSSALQ